MQFWTQHTLSFKMMYVATCYPSGMGTCHFWWTLLQHYLGSITRRSHITYYYLMFFIAYTFKGQRHVFAGWGKIVSQSSCRTSAILKYLCPMEYAQCAGSSQSTLVIYVLSTKFTNWLVYRFERLVTMVTSSCHTSAPTTCLNSSPSNSCKIKHVQIISSS